VSEVTTWNHVEKVDQLAHAQMQHFISFVKPSETVTV